MKKEGNEISDARLDELLQASPDVEPSAALLRAVAEIPIRHPLGVAAWWPFGGPRRWVMVLAAALAMGALVGITLPDEPGKSRSEDFVSEDNGYDALSTVALGADLSEELAP